MKKIEMLGKPLSKNEMKALQGGYPPCNVNSDCLNACVTHPNNQKGTYCDNGACKPTYCLVS